MNGTRYRHTGNETSVPELTVDADLLLSQLREGSEQAFTTVYDHFHRRLYFFALRFVPGPDAKDIVAETFIKCWQRRADFHAFPALQQFLFVSVRNRCFDHLKHELVKLDKQASILYELEISEQEDLELEELKTVLVGHIHEEAEKLPGRLKEVFLLSFIEGKKPGEIAEQLGLSVQTVRNQKLTALRLLRVALGERSLLLSLFLLVSSEW